MSRPRVLLADDHPGVAEELRRLLESEFDVVGVVADGKALVREVENRRPDVVVTDIVMPGLDGIAATKAILASRPDTRVVLVTVHDDPELAEWGYAAGARACVMKLTASQDLLPAVRTALRGERYPPPRAANPGGSEHEPTA
jgi:DNA-binding NarL/FixJ family response regulator